MSKMRKPSLCGCLVDAPIERAPELLRHPELDLVEWRLDLFSVRHTWEKTLDALSALSDVGRHPVLATNRPKAQGGAFEGAESFRVDVLKRAVGAGAEWVDLEEETSEDVLDWFKEKDIKILLSHHDFSGTPDLSTLKHKVYGMAQRGVDTVKITTYAATAEDNLRVLELIPFGRRELGIDIIGFCMGPLGRWSRVVSLLLGSPWTYVQLPGQSGSAPGQFTPSEIRVLLEGLP
jgi:3-dehydroquinate dehydratase type I